MLWLLSFRQAGNNSGTLAFPSVSESTNCDAFLSPLTGEKFNPHKISKINNNVTLNNNIHPPSFHYQIWHSLITNSLIISEICLLQIIMFEHTDATNKPMVFNKETNSPAVCKELGPRHSILTAPKWLLSNSQDRKTQATRNSDLPATVDKCTLWDQFVLHVVSPEYTTSIVGNILNISTPWARKDVPLCFTTKFC